MPPVGYKRVLQRCCPSHPGITSQDIRITELIIRVIKRDVMHSEDVDGIEQMRCFALKCSFVLILWNQRAGAFVLIKGSSQIADKLTAASVSVCHWMESQASAIHHWEKAFFPSASQGPGDKARMKKNDREIRFVCHRSQNNRGECQLEPLPVGKCA